MTASTIPAHSLPLPAASDFEGVAEDTGQTLLKNFKPRLAPPIADLLAVWQYVEHAALRILAGWGRCAGDWEDKKAVCYHVWLQAETVERLRRRLAQFPPHKPEPPVHPAYEAALNAVLLAPSFEAAMGGLHQLVFAPLTQAYRTYLASAHPVHDQPTQNLLGELLEMKQTEAAWYAGFVARYPVAADEGYLAGVADALRLVLPFDSGLPRPSAAGSGIAHPCGRNTHFAMPVTPGRVKDWNQAPNIFPLLEVDWETSVEARRLFFVIGYFWEMGVAEEQLRWVYYADTMPWEFTYAEARHLWDESRHGDSGLTRLRDFGLDIKDVGYDSYGAAGDGFLPPMTLPDLYERFYRITQIAERGFFKTKSYCFEDFAAGGDAASAEMMQFDIIDETSHAEFGRTWLDTLACAAGVDEDWNRRGAQDRDAAQRESALRVEAYKRYVAGGDLHAPLVIAGNSATGVMPGGAHTVLLDPAARAHYERLLAVLRHACPLTNVHTAPVRPPLPM